MKRLAAIALTAVACFQLCPTEAATISLTPASGVVAVGGPVTVDLDVSGLGNGTALGAFDISVNFDSADLGFQSATFGDPALADQLDLGLLGLNGPVAVGGTGTVDLIEADIFDSPTTLLTSQAHSFTLAALTFYGLAAGATPLTVTLNSLSDQDGTPFSATARGASVTLAPVPLPGAGILLVSALGVLGIGKRCGRVDSSARDPVG